MKYFKQFSTIVIAASIATTAFAGGHSSTPEEAAMKARKAHMALFSYNLGPLGAMVKEEMPYDAAVAQRQFYALRDLPHRLWPDPTGNRLYLGFQVLGAQLDFVILTRGPEGP